MGLGDLMKILEQASNAQATDTSSSGDPLSDLLGSLLGGGAESTPSRSSKSSGARRTSSARSASSNDALSGMLTPIVDELANKLGLPPELAQAVITFAISQLMNSQANAGGAASTSPRNAGGVLASGRGMLSNADGGLEPSNLVAHLTSGKTADSNYFQSTGLAKQLASQTGMSQQQAASSLESVFSMLSGGTPPSAPASSGSIFGKAGGAVGTGESKSEAPAKKSAPTKSHKK